MNDSTPAAPDAPVPAPVPETPPASSPPAAATVVNGQITEDSLALREQLSARETEIAELRRQVKEREITISEFEDRVHRLEHPRPVPVKRAKGMVLGKFV